MSRPSLRIERVSGPVWWRRICTFIRVHHRHHSPPQGWMWGLAVWRGSKLVAVATVGRAVAKWKRLEVTRVCALPGGASWGGCSLIYRTAAEMGATVTYTLTAEPGTSLRAAGWVPTATIKGRDWRNCKRRRRDEQELLPWEKGPMVADKIRWEALG